MSIDTSSSVEPDVQSLAFESSLIERAAFKGEWPILVPITVCISSNVDLPETAAADTFKVCSQQPAVHAYFNIEIVEVPSFA